MFKHSHKQNRSLPLHKVGYKEIFVFKKFGEFVLESAKEGEKQALEVLNQKNILKTELFY